MYKLFLLLLFSATISWASAQSFQPMNGDFEQWDGTAVDAEPTHWNSFATSTGTYASLASTPHHYHRKVNGNSYLTIYTMSIVGVKANGNMTTGRIYAGAMSASSSNNYNYTQRSNQDFSHPFCATPDSMTMRVSFYAADASSQAQITTYIHGDSDFKDPGDANNLAAYTAKAVAQTARTTTSGNTMQWVELKVPFNYVGTASPAYLLISITTNKTPGGGSANDSLSIDDIRFVYSSWLTDLRVNGTTIEGFNKGVLSYDFGSYPDSLGFDIEATTEVADATVTIDSSITQVITRADGLEVHYLYQIIVTAEDGSQQCYRLSRHSITDNVPELDMEEAEHHSVTIAPNPATDWIDIIGQTSTEPFILTDMGGRKVAQYPAIQKRIPLLGLKSGAYLLRQGNNTIKIIKK